MHCQQLVVGCRGWDFQIIRIQANLTRTAFGGQAAAGPIHKNPPHRLSRSREEVLPPVPVAVRVIGNLEPCFMNEGRGLERMAVAFTREPMRGQAAKFLIDQGQ